MYNDVKKAWGCNYSMPPYLKGAESSHQGSLPLFQREDDGGGLTAILLGGDVGVQLEFFLRRTGGIDFGVHYSLFQLEANNRIIP